MGDTMAAIEADETDRAGRLVVQPTPQEHDSVPASEPDPEATGGLASVAPGLRLANRYRLERQLEAMESATLWLAVDEMLRRPVGVHVLATVDERTPAVLRAARDSAAVTDTRFVQVLDAVEDGDVAYIVTEWIGDGQRLSELLAEGPLPVDEATWLASEIAAAMVAAHQVNLAHLELNPDNVLRTLTGQVKIRGLQIAAALRGTTSEDPAAADARGIGALLYAALTARWPFGYAAGLPAAPVENGQVCTPAQVRAGVPHVVDELTTRIVLDPPPRGRPLRTPQEVSVALNGLPRVRPTVPDAPVMPTPDPRRRPAGAGPVAPPPPPAPMSSGAGRAAKFLVVGVVVVALGLLGWQLFTGGGAPNPKAHDTTGPTKSTTQAASTPITPVAAQLWDSLDDSEHPGDVQRTITGTGGGWATYTYKDKRRAPRCRRWPPTRP
jgi:cytoskeletal protein RodZ